REPESNLHVPPSATPPGQDVNGARRAPTASDSDLLRRRGGEERHDVACKAPQAGTAACAAARAAAVKQHITGPGVAQRLELLPDLVGTAVHRADFVDYPRVTGGLFWPAMHRTVRSGRQVQLTHPVLQPALQRGRLFGLGSSDKEGPGHTDLHRIK